MQKSDMRLCAFQQINTVSKPLLLMAGWSRPTNPLGFFFYFFLFFSQWSFIVSIQAVFSKTGPLLPTLLDLWLSSYCANVFWMTVCLKYFHGWWSRLIRMAFFFLFVCFNIIWVSWILNCLHFFPPSYFSLTGYPGQNCLKWNHNSIFFNVLLYYSEIISKI